MMYYAQSAQEVNNMHRYVQRTTIEDCITMIQKVRYQSDIDRDDMLRRVTLKLRGVERAMRTDMVYDVDDIDAMVEDWMVD